MERREAVDRDGGEERREICRVDKHECATRRRLRRSGEGEDERGRDEKKDDVGGDAVCLVLAEDLVGYLIQT